MKMKKSIGLWGLCGFAVVSFLGTLLHFLYDLSGESLWIAPFSGVNESTWEHMKLLFWPMLLFGVIQSIFFKNREDFWCVKLRGILLGLSAIPILFYTYNGAIGKSPDWVNISIFFISAAVVYIYETRRLRGGELSCRRPWLSFAVVCAIGLLFALFTFKTPEQGIFRDPITGGYGI